MIYLKYLIVSVILVLSFAIPLQCMECVEDPQELLWIGITLNNEIFVDKAIKDNANVNQSRVLTIGKTSPLEAATMTGNLSIVRLLVQAGAKITNAAIEHAIPEHPEIADYLAQRLTTHESAQCLIDANNLIRLPTFWQDQPNEPARHLPESRGPRTQINHDNTSANHYAANEPRPPITQRILQRLVEQYQVMERNRNSSSQNPVSSEAQRPSDLLWGRPLPAIIDFTVAKIIKKTCFVCSEAIDKTAKKNNLTISGTAYGCHRGCLKNFFKELFSSTDIDQITEFIKQIREHEEKHLRKFLSPFYEENFSTYGSFVQVQPEYIGHQQGVDQVSATGQEHYEDPSTTDFPRTEQPREVGEAIDSQSNSRRMPIIDTETFKASQQPIPSTTPAAAHNLSEWINQNVNLARRHTANSLANLSPVTAASGHLSRYFSRTRRGAANANNQRYRERTLPTAGTGSSTSPIDVSYTNLSEVTLHEIENDSNQGPILTPEQRLGNFVDALQGFLRSLLSDLPIVHSTESTNDILSLHPDDEAGMRGIARSISKRFSRHSSQTSSINRFLTFYMPIGCLSIHE